MKINMKHLESCNICPHNCKINRIDGKIGRCRCGKNIKIALANLHYAEEPCISGKNGSGTVFFSNCNLKCIYCQNYKISQEGKGNEITIDKLAKIFLEEQENNAHNINLVTGTMYVPQIIEAIKIARKNGLNIPIIYNSNGYENVDTIKMLNGYIDIYLPDFKYYSNQLAKKYSGIDNYFEYATSAIKEMINQVGIPKFDKNGMIVKGVIIRHLILPNHIQNTKNVLKWIKENLPNDIYVSVMAQYFPTYKALEDNLINRNLKVREYKEIEEFLFLLNLENGYIQELGENEEQYVPNF